METFWIRGVRSSVGKEKRVCVASRATSIQAQFRQTIAWPVVGFKIGTERKERQRVSQIATNGGEGKGKNSQIR